MRTEQDRTARDHPRTSGDPSPAVVRRLLLALLLDFGITSIGCYALLPVLPVLLRGWSAGPFAIGAVLLLFSALRFCGFVVVNRLDLSRVRTVLVTSLACAAALMALAEPLQQIRLAMVVALLGVAVCLSVNSVMVRSCISEFVKDTEERVAAYSRLMVVTNLCSAGGPLLGAALFFRSPGAWLLAVAAVFALASLATALVVPAGIRLPVHRPTAQAGPLRSALANRELMRVATASFFCFVLYSQLFSAMPLYVFGSGRTASAGLLFLVNAVLAVLLQVRVGRIAGRFMVRPGGAYRMLGAVLLLTAASFALTGLSRLDLPVLLGAIVVFTVGETVLSAVNDQAFVGAKGDLGTLSAVKFRMVVTALGQSAGSFMGGSLSLVTARDWGFSWYWYAVAALGLLTGAASWLYARRGGGAVA